MQELIMAVAVYKVNTQFWVSDKIKTARPSLQRSRAGTPQTTTTCRADKAPL
jgi:hypothetical protein